MTSPSRLALAATALAATLALWPAIARPQPAAAERRHDAPDEPPEERSERFSATWRMVQTRAQARTVVDEAIEQAVDAMNFFFRGIARSRLREGTPIHDRIELEVHDDLVTVRFGGTDGYTTHLGRTEERTNPDGVRMRVTQRFRPNGQLEQSFVTDQGTRWYVYTLLRDGRLRVATTTDSPHMPQPMSFLLDYRRD